MTLHLQALIAILLMALMTYLTRIGGFLLLRGRTLSPRATALMEILPGCVLVSIIAPVLASGEPANIIGLGITALAATRLSLIPTMLLGIAATGVLRTFL
ncbi:AzlD family protein [Saccharibacter sp. 17.LH.SD]|uniref:AzlD family protein n=1 Tax=Saccharibacter sp. 17.LH.SD TaxID=2689393 RepID=UPI00136BB6F6|nr:AzlD family protein [Saccharibacter sp. 17.LH.SD]MXV44945.1 AzlD family protein [Saccharibacter sp. 17.LH.SD]